MLFLRLFIDALFIDIYSKSKLIHSSLKPFNWSHSIDWKVVFVIDLFKTRSHRGISQIFSPILIIFWSHFGRSIIGLEDFDFSEKLTKSMKPGILGKTCAFFLHLKEKGLRLKSPQQNTKISLLKGKLCVFVKDRGWIVHIAFH